MSKGKSGKAAAPLTLALSLNLVNINQFGQQTRQRTGTAIAQACIKSFNLHQQVRALPAKALDLSPITATTTPSFSERFLP